MIRTLTAGLFLLAMTPTIASAQEPIPRLATPTALSSTMTTFRPVGNTGDLLTAKSCRFWTAVFSCYDCGEGLVRVLTRGVGTAPLRVAKLTLFGTAAQKDTTDVILSAFLPWVKGSGNPAGGTAEAARGLAP